MKQEKKNREFSSFFSHTHKSLKSHTHQSSATTANEFQHILVVFPGTTWKKHLWRVIERLPDEMDERGDRYQIDFRTFRPL
jgi:hypothetical protein